MSSPRSHEPRVRRRLAEIAHELDTIRLDGADVMDGVVAAAHDVFGSDCVMMYSVRARGEVTPGVPQWELERWHQSGYGDASWLLRDVLARKSERPVFNYDAARPAREHRNRIVEATAWANRHERGGWSRSPIGNLLGSIGLGRHKQPRVLLCDGPALMGWFGTYVDGEPPPRLLRSLAALIRPLQRRLRLEHRLATAPRTHASLVAALDQLGGAACIVDQHGRVFAANTAARVGRELARALADAIAGRPSDPHFELVPLAERGAPGHYLAIVRSPLRERRVAAGIRDCATRWRLTGRQVQVLELVVRGLANATIAAMLSIGDRAVELHVSALLARAGVANRAGLVARVLAAA